MLSLPQHITLLHHVSLLAGVAVCFAWTAPTGAVQPEAFSAGPGARQINADINGDGMVNLDDFMILAACMAGPDEPVPPPGCIHGEFAASDLDGDADVDLRDFALFAEHFVQPPPDCNENGIPDDVDIAEGTSQDCNKNGVPDECDLADGTSEDCNENGVPDECDISGAVTAPNLVHRYRFDGTTADSMGGGDAVLYGGTSLSEDSLVLSGVDGHAELPIAGTIASLDSCTFEAWVRWNGGGPWQRVFDLGTATNNYFFLTPFSGSEARSAIRTPMFGEQQMLAGSALPSGGVLTHVAVTIDDATNTGRLYVDGVLAGPMAENTNVTLRPSDLGAATITYLGKSFWPDPYFNGEIVEFRVYDRALSAADLAQSFAVGPDIAEAVSQDCNENGIPDECDIASGYSQDVNENGIPDECESFDCNDNGIPDECDLTCEGSCAAYPGCGQSQDCNGNGIPDECDIADGTSEDCNENGVPDECDVAMPQLPASLIHRYRFNENANDEVSGAHASLLNGAFIADGAVVLDGVNDMVQLPIAATIAGLTDVTFEVWFVWEEGANAAVFTSQTSTQNYLNFSVSTGGSMFSITTPDVGPQSLFGDGITPGQLTHASITINAQDTFGRHYLNGVPGPFNTGMTLTPSALGANTNTLLGRSVFGWAPYFKGNIVEFRIYTEALSAADVLASYEAGPDAGGSRDCNGDGIPDECQLEGNDCNGNGIPDECDIAFATSEECN